MLQYEDHQGVHVFVGQEALPHLGLALGSDDVVVELSITADAPLPDLTFPRAFVSARGWATAAGVVDGRPDESETPPMALLRLELAEWHVHLPGGCHHLDIDDVGAAKADPLAPQEGDLLEELRLAHTDQLTRLVRGMRRPEGRTRPSLTRIERVRPVGLDRYGMTLLCYWPDGDPDARAGYSPGLLRVPLPSPCRCPGEAMDAVRAMLPSPEGAPLPR